MRGGLAWALMTRTSVAAAVPVRTAAPACASERTEGERPVCAGIHRSGRVKASASDSSRDAARIGGTKATAHPLALADEVVELVIRHHAVTVRVRL